jgi:hypothetical protein
MNLFRAFGSAWLAFTRFLGQISGILKRNWSSTAFVATSGLVLSLINFDYQFLRESSQTRISISHVEWNIADGRLGRGAQLGIVAVISNTGNSPSAISEMRLDAQPLARETDPANCAHRTNGTVVAWTNRYDGKSSDTAIAIPLSGNSIVTGYWNFESLPPRAPDNHSLGNDDIVATHMCLIVEAIGRDAVLHRTHIELGVLRYSGGRIISFERALSSRSSIKLLN